MDAKGSLKNFMEWKEIASATAGQWMKPLFHPYFTPHVVFEILEKTSKANIVSNFGRKWIQNNICIKDQM